MCIHTEKVAIEQQPTAVELGKKMKSQKSCIDLQPRRACHTHRHIRTNIDRFLISIQMCHFVYKSYSISAIQLNFDFTDERN